MHTERNIFTFTRIMVVLRPLKVVVGTRVIKVAGVLASEWNGKLQCLYETV